MEVTMTRREIDQVADIQAGIDEAERGEFATHAEVSATVLKYVKRGNPSCHPERSEGSHAPRQAAMRSFA
jgi:hypothetical protein